MTRDTEPRLVDTGRGFSVLYSNRHLYSRYDPSKNAVLAAQLATIKDETLVLCFSPLLCYGLDTLLEKLPASSFILALEFDENLMAFSVAHMEKELLDGGSITYIRTSSTLRVLETIESLRKGPFRRCMRIDLSGGVQLHASFYDRIVSAADEYISRYWRNHLTLMKLGRNYARNFFRNCAQLSRSFSIPARSSGKPVFVAGAGPSLDDSLAFIRDNRSSLFLLAVDTALGALRDSGLTPDAVILVESQFWIERAFAGFAGSRIPVYADLTARTSALAATGGPVHFFFSEYTKAAFIVKFRDSGLAPLVIPPLGSVGLVAVHLARRIAKDGVPVIFSGLDFSWGKGYTHCGGSPAVGEILSGSTRFTPAGSALPSFAPGVSAVAGKRGEVRYTDPSLSGYARLCGANFCSEQFDSIFDFGKSGIDTGCSPWPGGEFPPAGEDSGDSMSEGLPYGRTEAEIAAYLENERFQLRELRDILSGKSAPADGKARVKGLISEMDYLFLHFPDGYRGYSAEPNFLKRIRIELEYFLKTIEHT